MTRKNTLIALCVAALLSTPLTAKIKVQSQHQAGDDCRQYKTYSWLPVRTVGKTGLIDDDPTASPIIREAVNRELQAKGLNEVASGGEQQVATAAMKATSPHTDALIYGWFPECGTTYGTYWSTAQPVMTISSYSAKGAFVVNLIDTKTKKSAWIAMAKDTVDKNQGEAKIDKASAKMFADFPPKKP
ncbi:MAG TPA: DUF4136 domain-containing protein [Paludibaculum sp.]|jgi:hypothetical protein